MADAIGGDDYKIFVDATSTNSAASATLTWYKIWSEAGRADDSLLIHAEAMAYDPDTESTPQFDPVAVMLMLELLVDECDRMTLFEMEGIHFFEPGDGTYLSKYIYQCKFCLIPLSTTLLWTFSRGLAAIPRCTPLGFLPSHRAARFCHTSGRLSESH